VRVIKKTIKKIFRELGFDLIRYNSVSSHNARILKFFSTYNIDAVLDVGANIGQFAMGGYENLVIRVG
jgi:hypothetical protein